MWIAEYWRRHGRDHVAIVYDGNTRETYLNGYIEDVRVYDRAINFDGVDDYVTFDNPLEDGIGIQLMRDPTGQVFDLQRKTRYNLPEHLFYIEE